MIKRKMKKTASTILLVFFMLSALCACNASANDPRHKYSIEENSGSRRTTYPYLVRTESATWYLAASDIELLGKDALFEGLYDILQYQEADFADARAALSGYIPEKVEPIDIYTDFCGKAGISKIGGAYYNQLRNLIKVFNDWEKTKYTLLHEYVHYLTIHCALKPVRHGLFAEGIAEYVSKIVCRDRMLRDYFGRLSEEEKSFFVEKGAWDTEEDCLDPPLYMFGTAEAYAKGYAIGEEYLSTSDVPTVRTPEIQENPTAETISHFEAACIMAYLVDTYSEETVFSHMDADPAELETVFGETFPELYGHWKIWNTEHCKELGLTV